MAANVERFRKDLDRLIDQGRMLDFAMLKEVSEKSFLEQINEHLSKEKAGAFIKRLPDFKPSYEAWYSESLGNL